MDDDGLYLPEIGAHSLEQISRHNYYAQVFARAMRGRFTHLPYIGLYAGAGRARLKGTDQIVETSAMAVLRQEVPFTRYVFVDSDWQCDKHGRLPLLSGSVQSSRARVSVLEGDPRRYGSPVRVRNLIGEFAVKLRKLEPVTAGI